ncbi:hypothetical protein EYF80_025137 [Liparis tanakae]|uniref:Uncharacterized protein n=1 Tax=Liparis tanakae TaxID=230148 RepID=A0A4Z2HFH9_9TELE|nr:hypothetical protein EYF80_025137 [Liparis tanakae]
MNKRSTKDAPERREQFKDNYSCSKNRLLSKELIDLMSRYRQPDERRYSRSLPWLTGAPVASGLLPAGEAAIHIIAGLKLFLCFYGVILNPLTHEQMLNGSHKE